MVKARKCSTCGLNGHNKRTCPQSQNSVTCYDEGSVVKLFGVNLMEQKTNNNNNNMEAAIVAGHGSDAQILSMEAAIETNKGKKWTEEEHRRFLDGMKKLGKGHWRGISTKFVRTKTPTQVASHAQKYFLRQKASDNKKKLHSSIFDIPLHETAEGPQYSPVVSPVENAKTSSEAVAPAQVCLDDTPLAVAYPTNYHGIQQMLKAAPGKWQSSLENKTMPSFFPMMNYPPYGYMLMPYTCGNFATCVPVTAHPSNIPLPQSFPPSMFLPGPGTSSGA